MKNKKFFSIGILLLLVFIIETWRFVNGVNDQLWINSIRTITESTHQGANALNIQLEMDFQTLDRIWQRVKESETPEAVPALYEAIEPDVIFYLCGKEDKSGENKVDHDQVVASFLQEHSLGRGIIDSHICSVTGENVFNIYVRGVFADGTEAYLVKEYQSKRIAQQFTLSFYNNMGFSYLVNQNGNIMVRSGHKNSNKTVYNIFDMISEEENEPEKIELFRDSVHALKTGWARFVYDNQGMVYCYEPLRADSGWLLISIVPEGIIMEQAAAVLRRTMLFSGIVSAGIIMVFIIFYKSKMHESEIHTKELTEALNAADVANEAKNRFLMDMSHDIRTPLNAIMGMAAIAKENISCSDKVEDCLDKISVSGMHLLSLVSDILDMSQIEHGKVILQEKEISLVEVFQEAADMMKDRAKEAGLILETAPVLLANEIVVGDPARICQILLNIIRNAVIYTPSGGKVSLELTQIQEKQNGYGIYRFRCADTGIGIEPEFMERLFLPFERARNTTASKISGAGVGLTITKNLLDLMGGEISVESMPGKGSVFTVDFHLECRDAVLPVQQDEILTPEAADEPDYTGKRVLLVEDNELNMEIMEAMISETGVQIEKAEDGQQAVNMVEASADGYYDLIFMDIQMPVMDGYEAARRIRKMDRGDVGRLPIYAVSANALASDVKNSMEAGMNGHIPKPVDFGTLDKVLRQNLG